MGKTKTDALLIEARKKKDSSRLRNNGVDFVSYTYKKRKCCFLIGSKELDDWIVNLIGLLPFWPGRPGYLIRAILFYKKSKDFEIISGHSQGGGIAHWLAIFNSVFSFLKLDKKREFISIGAPPTVSWLLPIYPKNLRAYFKMDDIIFPSFFFFPYRYPVWPKFPQNGKFGHKLTHDEAAYTKAMKRA